MSFWAGVWFNWRVLAMNGTVGEGKAKLGWGRETAKVSSLTYQLKMTFWLKLGRA